MKPAVISDSWRTGIDSTMRYFDDHLQAGDYYLEQAHDAPALAEWLGAGAQRLGLVGLVKRDDFEAITKNLNPATRERLTARMNRADNRRTWWDVAISPPKDVSVYAAFADEDTQQRIEALHWEASKVAALEMERFLGVRVRASGADENKVGNCEGVVAAVLHDTARPVNGVPDPHLHTHLLFANAVYDRDSGQWLALQNEGVLGIQKFVRQVYYNELVMGLQAMGIQSETREIQNDFTIAGMDRGLVDAFSRRHDQVEDRARGKMERGMFGLAMAKKQSVVDGREQKVELTKAELAGHWQEIAGEKQLEKLAALRDDFAAGTDRVNESFRHLPPSLALDFVKAHAFQHRTVLTGEQVLTETLKAGRGNFSLDEAKDLLRSDPDFLSTSANEWSTRQALVEEKVMLRIVSEGMGHFRPLRAEGHQIRKGPPGEAWDYTIEQRSTVHGILESRDLVIGVNGTAGAGKTTLLKEVEYGLQSAGIRLVPLAPSGQATEVLRNEGFAQADTLQQWLVNSKLRQRSRGAVLAIDEAGMISAPDMRKTLELAKAFENRVILIGDTKQIQSVERGDAFRVLQQHSPMRTLRVEESRRQRTQSYKEAVTTFRHAVSAKQWIKAWDHFDELKAVREIEPEDVDLREASLLRAVTESFRENPDKMIVAARWQTIHALNHEIRTEQIADGTLGERAFVKTVYEPVHMTAAEKLRGASYQPGQMIELSRNVADLGPKGSEFKVLRSERGKVVLEDSSGQERRATPYKEGTSFQVFNRRTIEVREGDTVLINQNTRELKNGQRVKIAGIADDGTLTTTNGRRNVVLQPNFKHLVYGYAVTAHASQGATVDQVIVLGDGMTREQFYVAATRGKTGIEVFTNDRSRLEQRVKISGERKAAVETPWQRTTAVYEVERRRNYDIIRKFKRATKRVVDKTRRITSGLRDIPHWMRETLSKTNKWTRQQSVKRTQGRKI
jgi:conjugative relaxase-like TrwC/TraI family protein